MFFESREGHTTAFLLALDGWEVDKVGCSWCCTEVFGREKGSQFEGRGGRGLHFGVFCKVV